jgi:hypothetical protein
MRGTRSGGNNKRNAVGKVKNKVASPAAKAFVTRSVDIDPSSDEFDFSDEEDLPVDRQAPPVAVAVVSAVPSTVDYSSDTSQSSQRQKLPPHVLAALVADIQASGGISAFHLQQTQRVAHICDSKPEIYGRRGDKLREKIRKKVNRWQRDFKVSPDSWSIVLDKVGWEKVVSATKTKPAKVPNRPASKKPASTTQHQALPTPSPVPHSILISNPGVIPSSGRVETMDNTRKLPCVLLVLHSCLPSVACAN